MRHRVLLIDDSKFQRNALKRILEACGHVCVAAPDGPTGLKYLGSMERFDAVLCDIVMPHMSGYDVLRRIRVNGFDCTVTLMSESETVDDMRVGSGGLADWCITKPVSMGDARQVVKAREIQ